MWKSWLIYGLAGPVVCVSLYKCVELIEMLTARFVVCSWLIMTHLFSGLKTCSYNYDYYWMLVATVDNRI
jgi:hypothetical protein